jgi:hypothetical protein
MSLNIGQTSNFSPNQISGCHIWLDASTSNNFTFSSGSNIATWIDRSSNVFTATASNSPIYDSVNKRVWFSSASSQYMSNFSAPLNLAQRSFFFVIQEITNANVCGIMPIIPNPTSGLDYTTTNGMTIEGTTGVLFYANSGNYNNKAVASVPLAKGLYGETFASSSGIAYVNGTPGTSSNSSFTFGTSAGYGLGGRWGGTTMQAPFYNGYFHEVVVFNNALSSNNRQIMEGYLAWKWGINRLLPTTHPYYNTPVYSLNMPNVLFPLYSYPIPTFQPTLFPNCTLWLDAADRSSITVSPLLRVSQWRDKSGNGNNATAVGTITLSANIGGLPAMSFSGAGSTYFNGNLVNNGSTMTSFAVFLMNSSSYTSARVLGLAKTATPDFNNTLYTAAISRFGSIYTSFRASASRGSIAATFGSTVQNATVFTGASNFYYQNGTAGTPAASSGNFGYSNYEVAGSFGEESLVPFNGAICEVIHYTSALDTTQRQQIEGYLAWKWGIQGSLDASHPYKSFAFEALPPFPQVTLPPYATNGVFNPKSLTGIQLWIDAADSASITTSGSTVTAVSDKSGTSKTITVTNTVSYIPKQALVFTNSSGVLNLTSMPLAPYDIFTVATANSSTSLYRTLLRTGGAPGTHPFLLQVNTDNVGMWDSTAFRQFGSITLAANEKGLFYATMASDRTMRASKNGTETLSASTPAGNESQIVSLGNLQAAYSGNQPWGTLQEIIIYGTTVSTSQRQQVEGYLAWKWGLVGSLPSSHPYKLFPPPP